MRQAPRRLLLALALPTALGAQKVSLRLRPQVGDTIHMRMDQVTETAAPTRGDAEAPGAVSTAATRVSVRAIVRKFEDGAATVLAITDSVRVESSDARQQAGAERARRSMEGQRVTLRIAADGSMDLESDGASRVAPELAGLFASMPPTLPRDPVEVGETWHRTIPVPSPGGGSNGSLRAVFRLDSLSKDGDVAFISMRASLSREADHGKLPPGATFVTTGVLMGTMRVDRKRGWMTDSRTTVSVHSVATPPPGANAEPVHFRMKITQWLRAVDKR